MLFSLQFSTILQSLQWESSTSFERIGAVRCDDGDGDDNIHNDNFSTMARFGVWHCGRIVDIHIDLFAVAHVEGRGSGVWMSNRWDNANAH